MLLVQSMVKGKVRYWRKIAPVYVSSKTTHLS